MTTSGTRVGGLFSGIGGIELALEAFGCEPTWFCEYDPAEKTQKAAQVLEARFPGVPNFGDITKVDWSQVEPVDVVAGGYPCQPFSEAGKRKGFDDERDLWPHFANAVRVLRPRYVIAENVLGHLRLGFDRTLCDLAEMGFDARWGVVRASDTEAPHQRQRLFVLAENTQGNERRIVHGERRQAASDPRSDGFVRGAQLDGGKGRLQGGRGQGVSRRDADGCDVETAPDSEGVGWRDGPPPHQRAPERKVNSPSDEGGLSAPHAEREGLQGQPRPGVHVPESAQGTETAFDWGAYAPAIERWERSLGRPAPFPVDDKRRLDPRFVEWMMGFPEGWVTDILARRPALKALGNSVCPQQTILALHLLGFPSALEMEASA